LTQDAPSGRTERAEGPVAEAADAAAAALTAGVGPRGVLRTETAFRRLLAAALRR
jgi:hypothetical protein